jgi:molybdate transport system regulatory protein
MRKASAKSLPSLSVRIDLDSEARIGPGKIQLLENIRACGSISAAGRAMDMSYKRAWDLVDEINRICRQPAVERQTGGKNGGGAILTPFGISLVARYRKIERDAASAVRKDLKALGGGRPPPPPAGGGGGGGGGRPPPAPHILKQHLPRMHPPPPTPPRHARCARREGRREHR